jgi:hypothetical protein
LTAADARTGRILGCLWGIVRDMPLASLYFLDRWLHWGFVHCTALSCRCTHLNVTMCTAWGAIKLISHVNLYKICSVLLSTIHNRTSLRASPTLSGVNPVRFSTSLSILHNRCTTEVASGYFFVMAWHSDFSDASFYVQYFQKSLYWYVRHFGVHSILPLVSLFCTALHTPAAGRSTSPIPPLPNGNWQWTHYVRWSPYNHSV